MIDNVRFKILAAESRNEPQVSSARAANAGTVLARDGGDIHIATSEGILVIHEMQREGKQSMPAASVLDGLRIEVGGSLC